ncbi:uncharacterized protein LOC112905222 isoform X2 [Agrilus planipennis]|uniref:Mitochondrial inner membrane protein Mpv17 n=1 Tax=Agrilus planipennis TaxID=224129 RepID=A0A7F5RAK3_AGRPL|nr:uncharacterized protein LOC112905222 isoform X1 [Agrilus planipennis]XP_025832990.1 uncharacterized protein LOC112905222 isoform X2 [Agrilus planipennis]
MGQNISLMSIFSSHCTKIKSINMSYKRLILLIQILQKNIGRVNQKSISEFPAKLRDIYTERLLTHPYYTQCAQSAIIMMASDLIAQKMEGLQKNWFRTFRFGLLGTFYSGPVLCFWYKYLEYAIRDGRESQILIKKVLLDQLVFSPIYFFFMLILTLGLRDREIFWKTFREVLFDSYKLWPFFQIINFTFVPINYRILAGQLMAVLWNIYLSSKLHHERENVIISIQEEQDKLKEEQITQDNELKETELQQNLDNQQTEIEEQNIEEQEYFSNNTKANNIEGDQKENTQLEIQESENEKELKNEHQIDDIEGEEDNNNARNINPVDIEQKEFEQESEEEQQLIIDKIKGLIENTLPENIKAIILYDNEKQEGTE